jgi:ribosomal protein S18 acetylase RimI-like enzyme
LIVSVGLPLQSLASGTESERIAQQAKQHAADPATIQPDQLWTLALIHRHGHPSTEIWFFSSLELAHGHASHEKEAQSADMKPKKLSLPFTEAVQKYATLQLATVLSHVPVTSRQEGVDLFQQCKTFGSPGSLAGNVHSTVAALLAHASLIVYTSPPYGHYVYPAVVDAKGAIPDRSAEGLPEGLIWSTIQPSDHADVMAVNKIVRSAATIAHLPSTAVRRVQPKEDGSPGKAVAFGFASGDGSLRTLHVDPEFRRKGLAKAVVKRLLNSGVFAPPKQGVFSASREVYEEIEEPQPLAYSSVEKSNVASIKTFEGVGATWRWDVYWAWLDLDKATRMLKSG